MNNENKNHPIENGHLEQQKVPTPMELIAQRDILFGIKQYSVDDPTRIVIVERSPSTPDGETWPDLGWLVTGEGQHPKTGDVVVKLEKLIYDDSGAMLHDHDGNALTDVKYQPLDSVMKYDAEQRAMHDAQRTQDKSLDEPLAVRERLQSENLNVAEQVRPSAERPIRIEIGDAVQAIRYQTESGEERGLVLGYYFNNQDKIVQIVQKVDENGISAGEVAVLDGHIITSSERERVSEGNEYDKLFDLNNELNYSAEDAAVRIPESEGERLTRERRTRDAEAAASDAYMQRKGGVF